MFTFHRPKIYRSVAGCCICKAKSSSSRFTDSKKYETEFKNCFNLTEGQKRTGEICNACVLLIKRWKKLPKGTERNWNHVVDARAGPGGKSQLRQKLKTQKGGPTTSFSNNCNNNNPAPLPDHGWSSRRHKRRHSEKKRMNLLDGLRSRNPEPEDTSPPSPTPSDASETSVSSRTGSRSGSSISSDYLDDLPPLLASIIDTTYWKMEKVCCGTIFKGMHGEIMVHPQLLSPCLNSCLGSPVKQTPSSSPRQPPAESIQRSVGETPSHAASSIQCRPGGSPADLAISKRGSRQDSLGSDGSRDGSEGDDLDMVHSSGDEVKRSNAAESVVSNGILESYSVVQQTV